MKSIFSIIGNIIIQMRIAIGIDTLAYSNLLKKEGMVGKYFPIRTPVTMHRATHIDKYFSKKLIPWLVFFIMKKLYAIMNINQRLGCAECTLNEIKYLYK